VIVDKNVLNNGSISSCETICYKICFRHYFIPFAEKKNSGPSAIDIRENSWIGSASLLRRVYKWYKTGTKHININIDMNFCQLLHKITSFEDE
jgi:hypothetical protein